MKYKYLLLPLIFLLLLQPVFAGYFDEWYRWLHIPPEYTKAPDILYFLILPFLAVFAVVWGILTKIQIFPGMGRINMLLSLIFALALIYYGWVFKLVHFMLSFGTTFAFIAFMIMFFVGVRLHAQKKIKSDWKSSEFRELKQKEKALEDLTWELREEKDDEERKKIRAQMKELETRIDKLKQDIEKETT